jgi:hypothetical protein
VLLQDITTLEQLTATALYCKSGTTRCLASVRGLPYVSSLACKARVSMHPFARVLLQIYRLLKNR